MTIANCCLLCESKNVSNSNKFPSSFEFNNDRNLSAASRQVHVIFILRNLLKLSSEQLANYLSIHGNPDNWVQLCFSCNLLVDQAKTLFEIYSDVGKRLGRVTQNIVDTVKNGRLELLQDEQSSWTGSPSKLHEEIRDFVKNRNSVYGNEPPDDTNTRSKTVKGETVSKSQIVLQCPDFDNDFESDDGMPQLELDDTQSCVPNLYGSLTADTTDFLTKDISKEIRFDDLRPMTRSTTVRVSTEADSNDNNVEHVPSQEEGNVENLKCPRCDRGFSRRNTFQLHLRRGFCPGKALGATWKKGVAKKTSVSSEIADAEETLIGLPMPSHEATTAVTLSAEEDPLNLLGIPLMPTSTSKRMARNLKRRLRNAGLQLKCDVEGCASKRMFKTESGLQLHHQLHHHLRCRTCGKVLKNRGTFRKHVATHLPNQYRCLRCDGTYSRKDVFQLHMRRGLCLGVKKVRPNKKRIGVCFNNKTEAEEALIGLPSTPQIASTSAEINDGGPKLTARMRRRLKNAGLRLKCDVEGCNSKRLYKTEAALQAHQQLNHNLKCGTCSKVLKTRWTYRKHIATHLPNQHKCPRCDRTYSRKDSFKMHLRRCSVLTSNFKRKANLKTGRPKINVCNKNAKQAEEASIGLPVVIPPNPQAVPQAVHDPLPGTSIRNRRRRRNMGPRLKCTVPDCQSKRTFKTEAALKLHHDLHHNLKCGTCGKILKTRGTFRRHIRTHQPNQFKCAWCGRGFSRKDAYKQHMRHGYCPEKKIANKRKLKAKQNIEIETVTEDVEVTNNDLYYDEPALPTTSDIVKPDPCWTFEEVEIDPLQPPKDESQPDNETNYVTGEEYLNDGAEIDLLGLLLPVDENVHVNPKIEYLAQHLN